MEVELKKDVILFPEVRVKAGEKAQILSIEINLNNLDKIRIYVYTENIGNKIIEIDKNNEPLVYSKLNDIINNIVNRII